jgi:IS66 Orf2 like protein
MLSFSGSLKVFVAVEACDMRKGFNGLHALVTERLGEDPRQGALFLFSNRRHSRLFDLESVRHLARSSPPLPRADAIWLKKAGKARTKPKIKGLPRHQPPHLLLWTVPM